MLSSQMTGMKQMMALHGTLLECLRRTTSYLLLMPFLQMTGWRPRVVLEPITEFEECMMVSLVQTYRL